MSLNDSHAPAEIVERPYAATEWSDEEHAAYGTFTLPLKRSRPVTPVGDAHFLDTWNDYSLATQPALSQAYSFTSDETFGWQADTADCEGLAAPINASRPRMQTGCIPCLMKGLPCNPRNEGCKKALSADWNVNYADSNAQDLSTSLTVFRPDTKWRRSWRERHSLNFFVNFSAPQMAGFFDSSFWSRMVIQTSYYEPAILHAITAIGALHEAILQRALADEQRKAQAMEFALAQCNKSIAELTGQQTRSSGVDFAERSHKVPNSRLALTTCVLFTSFEALQGRCDSAVSHALQGRRLLQATDRPSAYGMTSTEQADLEYMRPIVERLEVQATALLDKGRRSDGEPATRSSPLQPVEYPYSLDHAHNMLQSGLNSVMRFMQRFQPTAGRDHIAVTMQEKYLLYVPWFAQWEDAFTAYLSANRDVMSPTDVKRAMVLKANHLVGTMLASVDQASGPVAYDAYEAEFRAIVDLSREVLAAFSCPPLPTLTAGSSGMPYLSFSLWVTDPLWMAVSRCRNPSIRQAAFSLLSQNPRQEGIWHAGPMLSSKSTKKQESKTNAEKKETTSAAAAGPAPSKRKKVGASSVRTEASSRTMSARDSTGTPETTTSTKSGKPLAECETRVKDEWHEMVERLEGTRDADAEVPAPPPERFKSHCQGRCGIPYLEDLREEARAAEQ